MTHAGEHCPVLFCVVCGKQFHVHPYRLARAVTCSVTCGQVRSGWGRAKQRYTPSNKPIYKKIFGQRVHRVLAAARMGRILFPNEVVHHVNGNKHDNRLCNLQVMTKEAHRRLHNQEVTANETR